MTDKKIDKTQPLVKVGDEIMFSDTALAPPSMARRGIVTKVGRVWIDVVHPNGTTPAGRFRLDTQKSGGSYSDTRFWTMEQYAEVMRERDDRIFLREQGINLLGLTWSVPTWTASTLADAIRLAQSVGDPAKLLVLIEDYGSEMHEIGRGVRASGHDGEIMSRIKLRLGLAGAEDNA